MKYEVRDEIGAGKIERKNTIFLERISPENLEWKQRLLCYYYYLNKNNHDFNEDWEAIKSKLEEFDKSENISKDSQIAYIVLDELIEGNVISNDDARITKSILDRVFEILENESKWECHIYDYLVDKASEHPIVAKLIVVLLSGLLTSLLSSAIYDGIKN